MSLSHAAEHTSPGDYDDMRRTGLCNGTDLRENEDYQVDQQDGMPPRRRSRRRDSRKDSPTRLLTGMLPGVGLRRRDSLKTNPPDS